MKKVNCVFALMVCLQMIYCSKGQGEEGDGGISEAPPVDAPLAAVLSYPINNTICETGVEVSEQFSRVNFQWNSSENTDRYDLSIENLENQSTSRFTNIEENAKQVDLIKGKPYAWQVTSRHNASAQTANSQRWQFYLSGEGITNYPPYPANLTRPASGSRFEESTTSVELVWEGSDPDGENLVYTLFFDTVNGLQSPTSAHTGLTANRQRVQVNRATTYYWRVKSTDPRGNSSFSATYVFLVE